MLGYRWFSGVVMAATTVAHAQGPVRQAPTGVTALVNVHVVPMDTERVLLNQTVLIEGERITALGPVTTVPVPAGAVRIDGTGKYLIPGLADCHAHINRRGVAMGELALLHYALSGVTTIRNMDYIPAGLTAKTIEEPSMLRLRARAAAGELLSPRIYTSGPWAPPQYLGMGSGTPAPRLDSVAAYVAAYKAAGYDFIKVHDEMSAVVESLAVAARRVGIRVTGHAFDALNRREGIEWALALKAYNTFEHLIGYDRQANSNVRRDPTNAADMATLRTLAVATQRAGVWNCPTLVILRAKGGGNLPPIYPLAVKTLHEAGAGLLLGTDATALRIKWPGVEVHRELAEFVRAGLTPYQALLTGTRNVAQYFGTLDSTGTVAVRKRADLVLLNGNPLQDILNTRQLAGVMLGGRWLSRDEIGRRLAEIGAATVASP